MRKIQLILATLSLLSGLAVVTASAQSPDDKTKMTSKQMMDKMGTMSAEDKAAMFDKMPEKDKMAAMKMSGHDMSKMSHSERMDMMGKMSADDKAAAFDKMPMAKKMSMMKGSKSDK